MSHSVVNENSIENRALIFPLIFLLCVCELAAILFFKETLYHLVRWGERGVICCLGGLCSCLKIFNEIHFRQHHHLTEKNKETVICDGNCGWGGSLITLFTFKSLFLLMVPLQWGKGKKKKDEFSLCSKQEILRKVVQIDC